MEKFVPVPARLPFEILQMRNPDVPFVELVARFRGLSPGERQELDAYSANDQRRLVADYNSWRSTRPWAPTWERYIEQMKEQFHRDYAAMRAEEDGRPVEEAEEAGDALFF